MLDGATNDDREMFQSSSQLWSVEINIQRMCCWWVVASNRPSPQGDVCQHRWPRSPRTTDAWAGCSTNEAVIVEKDAKIKTLDESLRRFSLFHSRNATILLRYVSNGQTLAGLRQQLRDGIVNPLDDDRLILDVIEVAIRPDRRRGTRRRLVYYALDHRRLKCMKDEGCSQVRVHVVISKNRILDNFVNNPRKKKRE